MKDDLFNFSPGYKQTITLFTPMGNLDISKFSYRLKDVLDHDILEVKEDGTVIPDHLWRVEHGPKKAAAKVFIIKEFNGDGVLLELTLTETSISLRSESLTPITYVVDLQGKIPVIKASIYPL